MIINSIRASENILKIFDSDIDPEVFLEGLNVELEHLDYWQDLLFISEIVRDHLEQDIDYYKKLQENNVENDERILKIIKTSVMDEDFSLLGIEDSELILGLNTELEHLQTTSQLGDLFLIMKAHLMEDPKYYSKLIEKGLSYNHKKDITESSYKNLLDIDKEIEKTRYNIKRYKEINDRENIKKEEEKLEYLENMKAYLEKYEGISYRKHLLKKYFISNKRD